MTAGSLLLALALLLLVALFVARPLLRPPERHARLTTVEALLTQKDALLIQVGELDFDHETGKIAEEVYRRQRARLMDEAAALLQRLDSPDATPPAGPVADRVAALDAEIEAAVAALRQTAPQGNGQARFCPHCGRPAVAGDRFCAYCGHALLLAEPA